MLTASVTLAGTATMAEAGLLGQLTSPDAHAWVTFSETPISLVLTRRRQTRTTVWISVRSSATPPVTRIVSSGHWTTVILMTRFPMPGSNRGRKV